MKTARVVTKQKRKINKSKNNIKVTERGVYRDTFCRCDIPVYTIPTYLQEKSAFICFMVLSGSYVLMVAVTAADAAAAVAPLLLDIILFCLNLLLFLFASLLCAFVKLKCLAI